MATREDIIRRVEDIKNELGTALYIFYDGISYSDDFIISNGNGYFYVSDKSCNGECYDGWRCTKYGELINKSERFDVSNVLLETEEDEYEFVGYAVNERRTIVYKMGV